MTDEEIARRWARRAGYELISYRRAALLVFRLTVRVLTQARKELPPIPEFILKSIHAGVDTQKQISDLLGLEMSVVDEGLRTLAKSDDILPTASTGIRANRWSLTVKGLQTLLILKLDVPEEATFEIDIDGLTRQAITSLGANVIRPSLIQSEGLLELPALPNRKPRLDEVSSELRRHLKNLFRDQAKIERDLVELLEIEQATRLFRDDVLALVFRAVDGNDIQVGLVVDGVLSDLHEAAFASADKASKSRLIPAILPDAKTILAEEIGGDLVAAALNSEAMSNKLVEADNAQREVSELSQRIVQAESVSEKSLLEKQLIEVRDKLFLLEADMALQVRILQVYDHRKYLEEAFKTAQQRVMIISPWIKASVVNDAFTRDLQNALAKGIEVYIGYGLSERGDDDGSDYNTVQRLKALASKNPNFHFVYFGDTHAKVLICDSRFAISTSFNWLSFRGDPSRKFRDESGFYIGIPSKCDELFAKYIEWFAKN